MALSARFQTVKKYREENACTTKDALTAVTEIIDKGDPDNPYYCFYVEATDIAYTNMVECVFQNSPLQYNYCKTVIDALLRDGHLHL